MNHIPIGVNSHHFLEDSARRPLSGLVRPQDTEQVRSPDTDANRLCDGFVPAGIEMESEKVQRQWRHAVGQDAGTITRGTYISSRLVPPWTPTCRNRFSPVIRSLIV